MPTSKRSRGFVDLLVRETQPIHYSQQNIHRIRDTLTSDLDHFFSTTLTALTGTSDGKTSELERAKLVADLTECLRVYDTLCLWKIAEEIIKRTVVLPYIKKVSGRPLGDHHMLNASSHYMQMH